jgi:hypothetical protein
MPRLPRRAAFWLVVPPMAATGAAAVASPAGQTVTPPGWNATAGQSGATVTAENASWNGALAPGQSATFGFNGTAATAGNNPSPWMFTLDGTGCAVS